MMKTRSGIEPELILVQKNISRTEVLFSACIQSIEGDLIG